jgi:6-phosphogluconolactonase
MSLRRLLCLPLVIAGALPLAAESWMYIGTYTRGDSQGIYRVALDPETGALGAPSLAAETENPSFLAAHPTLPILYAAGEQDGGMVTAFQILPDGMLEELNAASSEGAGACHLTVHPGGRHVAVANYSAGSIAVLPVDNVGHLGPAAAVAVFTGSGPHPQRQKQPHAHAVAYSPDGGLLLATDLGTDQIWLHRAQPADRALVPHTPHTVGLAPGAGPRHLAFHPTGNFLYVINELDNTVAAYAFEPATGGLYFIHTVGTLPPGFDGANTTAEVRVHPSGRFLYASNRGHDSIATFTIDPDTGRLTPAGHTPTGGKTPRNFNVDPSGRHLIAANQATNTLVHFALDRDTGLPRPTGHSVEVGSPVCVLFVAPPPAE